MFQVDAELRAVAARLSARFGEVDREMIEAIVEREAGRLRDATVQSFLALLVERAARNHLNAHRDHPARRRGARDADAEVAAVQEEAARAPGEGSVIVRGATRAGRGRRRIQTA